MKATLLSLKPSYIDPGNIDVEYNLTDEDGNTFAMPVKSIQSSQITTSDDIYTLITDEAFLVQDAIDKITSITATNSPISVGQDIVQPTPTSTLPPDPVENP